MEYIGNNDIPYDELSNNGRFEYRASGDSQIDISSTHLP